MPQSPGFETLASGYGLIEGPRVDPDDGLYFSDVRRGGVYRRADDGSIETVVPKRRGVGGIALHADGGVVVSGRNVCHVEDGRTRVLLERDDVPGFNDLFTDGAGRVITGSMRSDPFRAEGPRTLGECYRIEAAGEAVELYGGISLTNGIGFSPDGRVLYHCDTAPNVIIAHDVDDAGACSHRRVFATSPRGMPDGLAVDESGCVWIAAYGGGCLVRFTPGGEVDLTLDVPAREVTSLCFGGRDRRDLYVVTADNLEAPEREGTIFRTRVDTPGLAAPLARI
jgi:gluconolactonase